MKISYLITCSTETVTLRNLIQKLSDHLQIWNDIPSQSDEVVIVYDETNGTSDCWKELEVLGPAHLPKFWNMKILKHPLANDYGSHKNWGATNCSGDYIFQIDGDECPSEYIIGENLATIIDANPNVDLLYVPRINDFRGVTQQHAAQWGWKLTESSTYKRPIANWPDYQGRIFKNEPSRIKWDRRLHEKLIGHNSYAWPPGEEDYALYHDKTIEKQIETNIRYNKLFSQEENKGHSVT